MTHCRNGDRRDNLVLQEYLAYRIYNLLTDYSHRVRLAEITYEEAGDQRGRPRYGFLLEPWKTVAERTGATPVDADGAVNIKVLSPADANRIAVFNYMIGNEDWSLLWPEPDESCCHNAKPLLADGLVIPLPYDFDFAGIVNAPYAIPKPPNKSVRRRRYHGLCHTQDDLTTTLELFRQRQETIYALYHSQPELTERKRKSSLAYLDGFYEVINDPARVERQLLRRCKEE